MTDDAALLSVREVAEYLACAEETVKRLVRRGELVATRVGTRLRFRRADVDSYLANQARSDGDTTSASVSSAHRAPLVGKRAGADAASAPTASVQHLRLLADASTLLASPQSAHEAVTQVVNLLVPAFADGCTVYLVDEEGRLALTTLMHVDSIRAARARAYPSRPLPLPDVPAVFAAVIERGEPVLLENVSADRLMDLFQPADQRAIYQELVPASLLLLPLRGRDGAIGLLTLLAGEQRPPFVQSNVTVAETLARRVSLALDNIRLYRAEQRLRQENEAVARRAQLLADVGALLIGQLDPAALVTRVVELVVPAMADYCTVHRITDSHEVQLVAATHVDPDMEPVLRRLDRAYPLAQHAVFETIVRDGSAMLVPQLSDEMLRESALSTNHLTDLRALGPRSSILAPLRARERTLGVLTMGLVQSRRRYTGQDLLFAEELAHRIALTLDNMQLYRAAEAAMQRAEQSAERSARLVRVAGELAGVYTVDTIGAVILQAARAALHADAGVVYVLDNDGEALQACAYDGYPNADTRYLRTSVSRSGPLRDAIVNRLVVTSESASSLATHYPHLAEIHAVSGDEATITAPLLLADRVIGALHLAYRTPQSFLAEDRTLLATVAHHCAQALDRARLYSAVETHAAHAATLAGASHAFAAARLELPALLTAIATYVAGAIGDGAAVWLLSGERGDESALVVHHANPTLQPVLREAIRSHSQRLEDVVIQSLEGADGEAPVVEVILELDAESPAEARIRREGLPSAARLIIAPLRSSGQLLGVLAALRTAPGSTYYESDRRRLRELAGRAALALDNAQLYAKAQAAIQIRDDFVSMAAHELKTPLTVVLGQLQLLQRRTARNQSLGARDRYSLDAAEKQARRLELLIHEFLDLSRLAVGQLPLVRATIDADELARRVVAEIQPTVGPRHDLVYRGPSRPAVVQADVARLEQVLHNLVENGLKYSPNGGVVEVTVVSDAAEVRLIVHDQGIGIPEADLPFVFQQFHRGSNAVAAHISGFGIGLHIAKSIIELQGGTIAVESAEGVGSTFTIVLPRLAHNTALHRDG